MSHSQIPPVLVMATLAMALSACANLPVPSVSHSPSKQDLALTTAGGQTRTVVVTVPYDSNCSLFARYTKTYIQTFRAGYIGEWNTQLGFLENKTTDQSKRKAMKNYYLNPPPIEITDTNPMGMAEANCLMSAEAASEDGRTQARNELISNPPVP